MPRTYKPGNTSKTYKKYDSDVIIAALREYESTKTSFVEIGKRYDIPKSVLHRHYTRVLKKPGGQTALNNDEELYIIEYINVCSEWGYPLDTYDLRLLVKGYLDRIGINIKTFKDNLPGPDFVNSFLRRHKDKISKRISQNIKKSRASVSPENIEEYFLELSKSLEGVPLSNIVNYDETNLSDDPGKRKVLTKRGVKYPERVMNHSKTSTSLMMAAAADGTLLPCYVVYKSQNLYDSWVHQGPVDCRYNRTKTGWFDAVTFNDWVHTVAFSYFENKSGKKVLIGDNLSSHLSIDLIKECKERDIYFVFLPANSTHLTQPLDVAFFRPVKNAWRDILFNWKKSEGRNLTTVPKSTFPVLLKKLLTRLDSTAKENILAGFKKAGISPINKNKVLERLPGNASRPDESFSKEAIDSTVISMLKEMRYGTQTNTQTSNKRKKIEVRPGKSVNTDTENAETEYTETEYAETEYVETEYTDTEKAVSDTIVLDNNNANSNATMIFSPQSYDNVPISPDTHTDLDSTTHHKKMERKQNKTVDVAAGPSNMKRKTENRTADSKFKIERVEAGPSTMKKRNYNENLERNRKIPKRDNKKENNTSEQQTHAKLTVPQTYVIQNEDNIFKIPNSPPLYYENKNIKCGGKSQQDDANKYIQQKENDPKDYEEEFTLRNNIDIKLLNDLDINNMPIIFDGEDFCVDREIEIEDTTGESDVSIELKDKKQNNTNKVKIIANKEIKGKIGLDIKKMRKISKNHLINNKSKAKYYKNDSEILRDLMDENIN